MKGKMKPRIEFGDYLSKLSVEEHFAELQQFLFDMMDWTEQSDEETIYIELDKTLRACLQSREGDIMKEKK